MAMVRAGFRPVYRPRSVEFEEHIEVDGNYAQPVRIVGPDGKIGLIAFGLSTLVGHPTAPKSGPGTAQI